MAGLRDQLAQAQNVQRTRQEALNVAKTRLAQATQTNVLLPAPWAPPTAPSAGPSLAPQQNQRAAVASPGTGTLLPAPWATPVKPDQPTMLADAGNTSLDQPRRALRGRTAAPARQPTEGRLKT